MITDVWAVSHHLVAFPRQKQFVFPQPIIRREKYSTGMLTRLAECVSQKQVPSGGWPEDYLMISVPLVTVGQQALSISEVLIPPKPKALTSA